MKSTTVSFFGIISILLTLQTVHSAKILFLLPVASKSHVHVFEPLIKALGDRGHDILSLTPQKSTQMPPNVRQLVVVPIHEIFKTMDSPFNIRKQGVIQNFMNASMDYIEDACKAVYDNKEFQGVMKEKFDLVVLDILLNYCMVGVLSHFKAPSIYISTMVVPPHILEPMGTRLPPSFVPNPFLGSSDRMSFWERSVNLLFGVFIDILSYFIYLPRFEKIYMDKLGIGETIQEISANVSMVLSNSHFTLTYPRPQLPDVVEVGGMHAKPAKPLPKDLEDFVSGAEHGVIFFSLGSIAQGKDMPEEYRKIFVNVFSRLKQRVLWKWETETMPDLPKNVKLGKWLPQQDILGHKNVRLFITHGGLLSIQETVYHGVPLVGIPLFADQDLNAKQAEKSGFALTLEILDMTEEILESKIRQILDNPKFSNRAKELSTLWRDQPQTPLETAVFWTEYVIRHKGATHMRSASRDLNFFQYHSLDVIAFLLSILVGVLYLFKCICSKICSRVCGKSNSSKKSDKKSSKKTN